jgi:DNA-binding IclR family transcriptional regulator
MVFVDAMTTVGWMPVMAVSKSTSSPATELRATEALEKRAAKVVQRGYVVVRGEMGRRRSVGVSLWRREPAARRAAVAAVRFWVGMVSG